LRNLKNGINFQETYQPSIQCRASSHYTGSAIEILGGYSWSDVYPVARANNVVVVGGGCPVRSSAEAYIPNVDSILSLWVVLADTRKVEAIHWRTTRMD
jgi:hypothetical protein